MFLVSFVILCDFISLNNLFVCFNRYPFKLILAICGFMFLLGYSLSPFNLLIKFEFFTFLMFCI